MNREKQLKSAIEEFQKLQRGIIRRKSLSQKDIGMGQKAALHVIGSHRPINIKLLSQELFVTSGAATQLVESLVQNNLALRIIDESDRRNVLIQLSAQGRKRLKEICKERDEFVSKMHSDVSDQDLEIYVSVMKKVNIKLNETREN